MGLKAVSNSGGGGGGSGTVTSASVVSANGLAGTVATATTTPAITLSTTVTGLVKGNGTALSAAVAGTDYVPALQTVVTKTANYSVLTTDDTTIFTNTGASASVTFTLPTAAAGHNTCYIADTAQTIVIAADTGHTIRNGASVTAASGNFTSNGQIGAMLSVVALNSTEWYVTKITGSWTVN